MASGNIDEILVRESLECPICKDFFHEPKQLMCGHTFCQGCIEQVEKTSYMPPRMVEALDFAIQCPQCRDMCVVPQAGLSTNWVVKEMVEKFRDIGMSASTDPDSTVSKIIPCHICTRQTPFTEMFMCKSCESPNKQKGKLFLCSLCVIMRGHKDHEVAISSELADDRDREEAFSSVEMIANKAGERVKCIKLLNRSIFQELELAYKNIAYNLRYFNKMKADCMEEDILKQELVNKVKEARSMGEIIDQAFAQLNKIGKEAIQGFKMISSTVGLDNLPISTTSQDLIDFGMNPSTSNSNSLIPPAMFSSQTNCFAYNNNENNKRRAIHKRRPRRVSNTANDDSSAPSPIVLD